MLAFLRRQGPAIELLPGLEEGDPYIKAGPVDGGGGGGGYGSGVVRFAEAAVREELASKLRKQLADRAVRQGCM